MVKTWGTAEGDDFTCPHEGCGARYKVELHRVPVKDEDSATCMKCRKVMKSWRSTTFPSFTLITE